VFAVPGSIYSPTSMGTNRLIQDGAKLTTSVEDIIDEIRPGIGQYEPASKPSLPEDGSAESRVYNALDGEPVHVDELSQRLNMPMPALMSALSMLEVKRCIRQQAGKMFTKL